MTTPVFFLIAGESSGDLLGARLMRSLRSKLEENVRFVGIGGPQMLAEGLDLLFPHTELMHFGIIEILKHIPHLLKRMDETVEAVLSIKPNALVTIDSPDFCFRVAKRVKKQALGRIRLIHYVAPTVWAWRPGRAKKIATFLDHLLVLFPFEPPYFTKEGLPCTFVGHSVVESGADKGNGEVFRFMRRIPAETPLLTVLLGSRTSEVSKLLPIFHRTVQILHAKNPELQIVVPVVPHLRDTVAEAVSTWGVPAHIVEEDRDKFAGFAASTAALACSGSVALELALARLPSVVAYKLNPLTVFIYRRFIRVAYVNLVNIMHDAPVVPEFLQQDCTPEKLAEAVNLLLNDKLARKKQAEKLETTSDWLGLGKFIPSERAAETVLSVIEPPAVLQVLPALVTGGVERGTVETAEALAKNGFRAIVASAGGPMAKEIDLAGGLHITLPMASKNPLTMAANVWRLVRLIRRRQIDIVHVRSRAPAWSAWLAAKITGAVFVTTFHNAYNAAWSLKRFYNSAMAKGEHIIAISNFVADYARYTYGVKEESLTVIPRGVDIGTFDPKKVESTRCAALKEKWNIAAHQGPIILMPGRLTRWKGQLVLIDALAGLKRRDFICVIIGGGKETPYGQEVANKIKEENLTSNVIICDTCQDMPAAYLIADLVVVPSTRPEGFGRVVVEAQAMGIPVIATDHGGAKETVLQEKTGWLTPPKDVPALTAAIDKTLSLSAKDKETYAATTRQHIENGFTTSKMTSKTLDIYLKLLQKRSDARLRVRT